MKLYEYDTNGWLVGWYEAETARPDYSTQIPPLSPVSQSRWVNGAWTIDPTRETQQLTAEEAARIKRTQAIAILKAYNSNTATAAEVRAALGASILLLRDIIQEMRS